MKIPMKEKVFVALDSRSRGAWWFSGEVRETLDEMFPGQAPHKLERVIIALQFLEMADKVEHRLIADEEDADRQRAQYALTVGGIGVHAANVSLGLNPL